MRAQAENIMENGSEMGATSGKLGGKQRVRLRHSDGTMNLWLAAADTISFCLGFGTDSWPHKMRDAVGALVTTN
jgi:hypothetical protein